VVDDNLDAAHAFAIMVERIGHKVEFALKVTLPSSGPRNFRPVVFLDLVMPGMSEFEVARRLKKELADGIHVIAVTACADPRTQEARALLGEGAPGLPAVAHGGELGRHHI
jgi:CheY-like chemotaxis protein